jgi:NADH-quinone oxidoreductase subunit I
MCATVCPAQVIEIDAAFDPDDPAHPKYPSRFEIDYSRCIFCGLCVEACPEDAIRMVKEVPELPSADREHMWLKLPELLTWNPQSDVAKPYPAKNGAPVVRPASAGHGVATDRKPPEGGPTTAGAKGGAA